MKENLHTEFKSNFNNTVIETIVAFANTKGGKCLIGVEDDGSDRFGDAVATGDFNNDGFDDILAGANFADVTNFFTGKAYIYFGNSSGKFFTYFSIRASLNFCGWSGIATTPFRSAIIPISHPTLYQFPTQHHPPQYPQ